MVLRTHFQRHSALLSFLRHRHSLPDLSAGRHPWIWRNWSRTWGSLLWTALTNIVCIEILAEVRETSPSENEEVYLREKFALFWASVQCVPDDAPELLDQGLRFHRGSFSPRGHGNGQFRNRDGSCLVILRLHCDFSPVIISSTMQCK